MISVVVPTFNEPALRPFLERLDGVLAPRGGEIVVVDDSDDAHRSALLTMPANWRGRAALRVLTGRRRGKGDALRTGLLAAEGSVVLHLDADIDDETVALIPAFADLIEKEGYDVVIAERRSGWVYRNFGRFILSIVLFLLQRLFVFQSARFFDTQCGFKAYTRDAARRLASLQTVEGGMVDIEYLYIAVKDGMRIAQVPVAPPREVRPSRLRILRCIVNDPVDLLRVKWNGLRGKYVTPPRPSSRP